MCRVWITNNIDRSRDPLGKVDEGVRGLQLKAMGTKTYRRLVCSILDRGIWITPFSLIGMRPISFSFNLMGKKNDPCHKLLWSRANEMRIDEIFRLIGEVGTPHHLSE
jgi:hypothetical protein